MRIEQRSRAKTYRDATGSRGAAFKNVLVSAFERWHNVLFGVALVAAIFFIYRPVWNGRPLVDDFDHLIGLPALRSLRGLLSLWITPPRVHQYHPLVDTVFWVGSRLWGDSMLGYHLVTISLHAVAALLLLSVFRRLEIRGGWLAAAVFALHPIQVESVAWIVEMKNTLSAVFFFGCILVYLDFDRNRRTHSYIIFSLLFVLGMMAKPILASLPAVILIVLWWKRGKIDWKRDLPPLLPFVILGVLGGLLSLWMEREFSGSQRGITELSIFQRVLIAGRAFWWYLAKIVWPSHLCFMYPRWRLDPHDWRNYFYPAAAVSFISSLWWARRYSRAPLAGLLFFLVTIFPLLGFFDISFFRFAYVADHFAYVPIVGIIAPICGGVSMLLQRITKWQQLSSYAIVGGVLTTLGLSSWQHSRIFRDLTACYKSVLECNPDSWAAHINLGFDAAYRQDFNAATAHFQRVLETNRDVPVAMKRAHIALSGIMLVQGRNDEAKRHIDEALRIDPNYAEAHGNLGRLFIREGRLEDGVRELRKALQLSPHLTEVKVSLARILATAPASSIRNGPEAVALATEAEDESGGADPRILRVLAAAYAENSEFDKAIKIARDALRLLEKQSNSRLAAQLEEDIGLYQIRLPRHEQDW